MLIPLVSIDLGKNNLQDVQKAPPARPQPSEGTEAYPLGTLRVLTMRERSWRTFSTSCQWIMGGM